MIHVFFAAEEAGGSPLAALGVNSKSLIFQIITFLLVFLILKKFAFKPITKMLIERRKVIEDGVKMGLRMEKEKAKLDSDVAEAKRKARHEADQIIAAAHKDAREVVREAEKGAQKKVNAMLADADERMEQEAVHAKKRLEKDIVGLVSEATEAIVGEKIDATKDAKLIDKALKGQK